MSSKARMEMMPVAALLIAALFWGLLWFPLRWLEARGMPGLWATAILFTSAFVVGSPLLWRWRGQLGLRPGVVLGLLLSSGWCNTSFILAVLDGQVVRVLLLFYLSPVWAVLLARVMLGERMPSLAVVTLIVAVTGALIILWDPTLGMPWPQGHADWLAISSGMTFALSNVFIRMGQDLSLGLKTVISWFGVALLSGVMAVIGLGGDVVWHVNSTLVAVALGIFGIVVVGSCLVYGVTRMPVHRSAVILLFEVVVGAVSAQWLAGEALNAGEWIGGILVLCAAWLAGRQQLQE